MRKKILVAFATAVVAAAVAPAMASASTLVPAVPTGDNQAYLADSGGNPTSGTVHVSGALSLNGAASVDCSSNDFTVDLNNDGTGQVTAFTAAGCSVTGFPNCTVSVTPTNLNWGARLVYNTPSGPYRLYVNAKFHITFAQGTPSCPAPAGTYDDTGLLSPAVSFSGSTLSATFGAGSGSVSGPLGTATVGGTVTGSVTSPSTGEQFVF